MFHAICFLLASIIYLFRTHRTLWLENLAVLNENSVRSENAEVTIIRAIMVATTMSSLFVALFALVTSSFRTRASLQAEILALRHQLAVFQKNAPHRLRLQPSHHLFLVLFSPFSSASRR